MLIPAVALDPKTKRDALLIGKTQFNQFFEFTYCVS